MITSLHIANLAETYLIDGLTSLVAVLLTFSCFFSFASIRTTNLKREKLLEKVADYFFAVSLVGVLIVILFITFSFI